MNTEYKILYEACDQIKSLLAETIYGTKGLRYRHIGVEQKVLDLHKPTFHTLWEGDLLLAVSAYCDRTISHRGEQYDACYIRYFSVSPKHQGKGLGKLLTSKIEEHYRTNRPGPSVFYAYIEGENKKSMGVSKHFDPTITGKLKTTFISRFFPKTNSKVRKLKKEEMPQIKKQCDAFHQNFTTYFNHRINYKDNYFVWEENGKIVAGIQANPIQWKMENLPGFMGWLNLNILPHIPILKRLADGKVFNFIALEGAFHEANRENELMKLIEHTMAAHKVYKAFTYRDIQDPLHAHLQQRKDLGLLSKIQHSPGVNIICNFIGENDQSIKQSFTDSPKYISGFDVT